MLFASATFLHAFLPVFLAVYFLTPRRWRSLVIALASYVFYGWWRPDFLILMLGSTVVDYTCGARIASAQGRGGNGKPWLLVSLFLNLGLLAYFKYANFGVGTLNALFVAAGLEPMQWTQVVLPVGISFYTFQTLSYTIDVYRGHARPVERFVDFMCYVALFPQLVAGPIVRYQSVADQLRERRESLPLFHQGVLAFQAGLVKKVLVADVLADLADAAFHAQTLGVRDAWTGALAYTFQIYFDFSGYSDMAIGLGLMMGFRFPINFDQPYRSRSITEFWRRWHVSLSSWLRDYLYLPLGGNRKGPGRTYVNLSLVMLLGGLWHGAAWTFVAWGAYQGLWLVIERAAGKRPLHAALPAPLQVGVTFVLVIFGWILFRAADLPRALHYMGNMLGLGGAGAAPLDLRRYHYVGFLVAGVVTWFLPTTQRLLRTQPLLWRAALQVLFLCAVLHLLNEKNVPFLYFQF